MSYYTLAEGCNPKSPDRQLGFLHILERRFFSVPVSHAAGKFGNFSYKELIISVPVDNYLISTRLQDAAQSVCDYHRAYLPHLVCFGFAVIPLQVDLLLDPLFPEDVMAPLAQFHKSQSEQYIAQILKRYVCV
jgi:hypothetical protein